MNSSYEARIASLPTDLRYALGNFDKDALKILEPLLAKLEHRYLPPTIYHYTTAAGLRGILGSGTLWLTDIFTLNDPSELRHGFTLAADVLENKVKNGPNEYRLFADDFKRTLNAGIEGSAHYFVCSFSGYGDDLSQWRGYADSGNGYALGFDAESLEKCFCRAARTPTSDGEAFPICYDDTDLLKIHEQTIDKALLLTSLPHGRNLLPNILTIYWAALLAKCAVHLLHPSVYFKNKAYVSENEYRFLELHRADKRPPTKLRQRGSESVKYREFDWRIVNADVLRKIVVGPAANYEKARAFAQRCLDDSGFKNVEIVRSDIPYRSRP